LVAVFLLSQTMAGQARQNSSRRSRRWRGRPDRVSRRSAGTGRWPRTAASRSDCSWHCNQFRK